jgi:polyisoprenoid-binding protein YceI
MSVQPVLQGTTRWTVQHTLSCASFAVRNLGLRTVRGRVPISHAAVVVDTDGNPVEIHAELDLAGLDTANARRDRDLAKPSLLDLAKFPSLTFSGGPGEATAAGWTVPGRLSAHGSTIEITLHVVRDGEQIIATTSFDRADLGIRAPRLMIGRRITVRIDAVLTPDQA